MAIAPPDQLNSPPTNLGKSGRGWANLASPNRQ